MKKWIGLSLGAVLGIGHIGMIGMLANKESKLPSVDIPVGDYTSYKVSVSEEGYAISYKANDPKTAFITKDIKEKGGFLGLANETTVITEEYFMDGQINQGGAVSNNRSWLDQKAWFDTTTSRSNYCCPKKAKPLHRSNWISKRNWETGWD